MKPLTIAAPTRIAIFQALFLGDLLCATPAINAVKRRFPGAEITLIGLPWARELADRLPAVDRFEVFPGYPGLPDRPVDEPAIPRFFERARRTRYDLAVQLHGSGGITNEIVAALGAAAAVGYGPAGDAGMTATLPWREDEREVMRWLRLVDLAGTSIDRTDIELPVTEADRWRAAELVPGSGPLIGLHAGAKDPARRWPAEQFAELGDALAIRHRARIVLTGAESERPLTAGIRERMRTPALDLAGSTDLGALAAVIARLDLLVTNDTGASHVAAAVRTPSVVLFGPSRPSRWAPLDGVLHTAVDARLFAAPDVETGAVLRGLPVEAVLAVCEAKLRPALKTGGVHRERALSKEVA